MAQADDDSADYTPVAQQDDSADYTPVSAPAQPQVNMTADTTQDPNDLNNYRNTAPFETGNPGYKYHYKNKTNNEVFSNTLPSDAQAVTPVNPAEDFSPTLNDNGTPMSAGASHFANEVGNVGAGMGQDVSEAGRGINQALMHIGARMGHVSQDDMDNYDHYVAEKQQEDAPLLNSTGGMIGKVAARVGETAIPGAGSLTAQAVLQGGRAMLDPTVNQSEPSQEDEDVKPATMPDGSPYTGEPWQDSILSSMKKSGRVNNLAVSRVMQGLNAGTGAFVGGGLTKIGTKIAQPFESQLGAKGKAALQVLNDNGITSLDTAQATGNKAAQSIKALTQDAPLVGQRGWANTVQKPEITQAVLKNYAGLDAPETQAALAARATRTNVLDTDGASPDIMAASKAGAENTRNEVFGRNPIRLDGQFQGQTVNAHLNDLWDQLGQEVSAPNGADPVKNIITKLRSEAKANGGTIPTNTFQAMRTETSNLATTPLAQYGGKLGEILDNAMATQESVPGDAMRLFTANQRLSNLHNISQAVDDDNQISLPALKKTIDKAGNTSVTVYGKGTQEGQNLWDLAQAGARLLPDKLANSQTARRITGMALPALGVGAYEGMRTGDWKTATELGIAGGLAPIAGNSLLYGMPRAYVTRAANSPLLTAGIKGATRVGAAYGANVANPDKKVTK